MSFFFRLLSKYTKAVQAKLGQGLSAFAGAFSAAMLLFYLYVDGDENDL